MPPPAPPETDGGPGGPPRRRAAPVAGLLAGVLVLLASGCDGGSADGADPRVLRVAVAANFLATHEALAAAFERETGARVVTTTGSTGQLHGQIVHGAPWDLFLAADADRARDLVSRDATTVTGAVPYARGRLALWVPSASPGRPAGPAWLEPDGAARVALGDPRLAPYGRAAEEALRRLLGPGYRPADGRWVRGTDVTQAAQFVASGAAEAGFVARSQVEDEPSHRLWTVPERLHAPIRQEAVVSATGDSALASAYLRFLRSPEGAAVLRRRGYEPPGGSR